MDADTLYGNCDKADRNIPNQLPIGGSMSTLHKSKANAAKAHQVCMRSLFTHRHCVGWLKM